MMRHLAPLANALAFITLAALVVAQRDIDGGPLLAGYHGLGLVALLAFSGALLNFRGALSAFLD